MIEQGPFSPFHQARWIELYNNGSATIPAYGIAEITSASRPESTTVGTPGGGRTVLYVRRPTSDNVASFAINGPLPIVAGKTGFGTQDYPCYVAYTGSTPVFGASWGPASGTCLATEGKTGLIIYGDASGGLVRVARDHIAGGPQWVGENDMSGGLTVTEGSTIQDFTHSGSYTKSTLFSATADGYEWLGATGTTFFANITVTLWAQAAAPTADTQIAVALRSDTGSGYPTSITQNFGADGSTAWILHRYLNGITPPNRTTLSATRIITLTQGQEFKPSFQKLNSPGEMAFQINLYRGSFTLHKVS